MADDTEPGRRRLTADVVLFTKQDGALAVLLVQRGKDPFQGALALPGGFVEPGERAVDAAAREVREETGIEVAKDRLKRFGSYKTPGRDPRGVIESVAFHGYLTGAPPATEGGDAAAARWVALTEFFNVHAAVAFDHRAIVSDAVVSRFGFRHRVESLADVHFRRI
ncbi:NUDIX domain-containing protein, partial [Lentzea albidocapillata]|uniref:8-oxo-dGTP diphosphatase n=1 Tax=Lentzea albidocapillata TaxID=40571 RepID=A0A1W2FGS1_9PSEU